MKKKNLQSSLSLLHLWSLSLMPSHGQDPWAPPPLLAAAIAEATTLNIQRWSRWSPMATSSSPSNSPDSHRLLRSFVHNNNNNDSGLSQTEKEWTPMLLLLNLSKRERERERERDCRLSQIVVSLKVRVVKFKFLWFWGWFFFFFGWFWALCLLFAFFCSSLNLF